MAETGRDFRDHLCRSGVGNGTLATFSILVAMKEKNLTRHFFLNWQQSVFESAEIFLRATPMLDQSIKKLSIVFMVATVVFSTIVPAGQMILPELSCLHFPMGAMGRQADCPSVAGCNGYASQCVTNGASTQYLHRDQVVEFSYDGCVSPAASDCVIPDFKDTRLCMMWNVFGNTSV